MSPLRGYQHDAINALFAYFERNTGNPVVAMPTGTGKSHVISGFIQKAMHYYPRSRFLVLTHVKELVAQNAEKLLESWPNAPMGIYSAGLGRKEMYLPITFGGIASCIKDPSLFGWIDILFVDECHLLSPNADTMYGRFIAALRQVNPYLKIIGLSATPWRMGQGHIVDGSVFTDMAIDMTGMQAFNWFLAEGYLTKLIPRPAQTKFNLVGLGTSGGDINQSEAQERFDEEWITRQALQEAMHYGHNRRKWLVFASGVDHADHVCEMLNQMGIATTVVHRGIPKTERDQRIKDYKAGKYRAIVNNNILTTGFDDPAIDFIVMLRKTISPGLWVQMLGRGTRPFYILNGYDKSILDTVQGRFWAMQNSGKYDCLVLDFGGNAATLGPINDPKIPKKKGEGSGDPPVKLCKTENLKAGYVGCGVYNHPSVRNCDNCGAEFDFNVNYRESSFDIELIANETPIIEWFNVSHVFYQAHVGPSGTPCLRVTYWADGKRYMEHIFLEGKGYMLHQAKEWWKARAPLAYDGKPSEVPMLVKEALPFCHANYLKKPRRIGVHVNKKPYHEVKHYEYE